MTQEEIFAEAPRLRHLRRGSETGTFEALQAYAATSRNASFRAGSKRTKVVGIVLCSDVLARSLFASTDRL